MSRYFINLCYSPSPNGLKHPPPLRWLGMLQVTWSLCCLNLAYCWNFSFLSTWDLFFLDVISTIFFLHALPWIFLLSLFKSCSFSLLALFSIYACIVDHPYSVFQVLESLLSPFPDYLLPLLFMFLLDLKEPVGNNKEYE